MPIIQII